MILSGDTTLPRKAVQGADAGENDTKKTHSGEAATILETKPMRCFLSSMRVCVERVGLGFGLRNLWVLLETEQQRLPIL